MPKGLLYDLTGQRIGKWTVLHRAPNRIYNTVARRQGVHTMIMYRCRCDCGYEADVRYSGLVNRSKTKQGATRQCVLCYRRNRNVLRLCSRAYHAWQRYRCERTVPVYPDWQNDAQAFYKYVGDPPSSKGYQVYLADLAQGLVPGNVSWKTIAEAQNDGRRKGQVLITVDGVTQTSTQWARTEGVSKQAIEQRTRREWSKYTTKVKGTREWSLFWDMHSGGDLKEPQQYIYIEAPEQEALRIFYARLGHNPFRITCSCCGSDYAIYTSPTLQQLTGFYRGCQYLATPKYKTGKRKGLFRPVKDRWFKEHYYLEPEEELQAKEHGYEIDGLDTDRPYQTLDEYLKRKDVLVIYTKDIKPEERNGPLPTKEEDCFMPGELTRWKCIPSIGMVPAADDDTHTWIADNDPELRRLQRIDALDKLEIEGDTPHARP